MEEICDLGLDNTSNNFVKAEESNQNLKPKSTNINDSEFMEELEDSMNPDSSYNAKIGEINEGYDGRDELETTVDDVVEPIHRMIFDTALKAYEFYNGYERKIGFSVRK
ncbi:hypothetical protein RHGRI_010793 [Rhododendron griersonianum]|uniref:Uncharacterized protein n=1 Tax=Rhododendron griersonianum TaxID=479676 RepID=A0AAV6KJM2_9ERIC|nr:hypothetical protein RHGRI_010793 [Rhododendron griersonianum]